MTALAPDRSMLSRRARHLVQAGRMSAAKPLIAALVRVAPDLAEGKELQARVLHFDGRTAEAEALLGAAIAASPDAPALRLCRAEFRLQNREYLGGADDAAAAVIADPSQAAPKALLGVALIELGRYAEAATCLREAVAAVPNHASFREAYAQALERDGDRAAALAVLRDGIALSPGSVALRVAAIMTAMRGRDPEAAAELAEAARLAGVADARVFGLLGHSRSLLGQTEAATQAYEEALKLAPEDGYVRYLVAASGLLPSATRAPAAYLRKVFDGYAQSFEAHLISLRYRIPGLIRAALLDHLPALRRGETVGPALDLGCGTGLVGVVLSDLPIRPLCGVDISPRMLDQARAKGLYAELLLDDIESALACTTLPADPPAASVAVVQAGETAIPKGAEAASAPAFAPWQLLIAADTLCYFGPLDGLMRSAYLALRPGGLFVFSVEELDEPPPPGGDGGWRLGPLGRYAHRADMIRTLVQDLGFTLIKLRREVIRQDRGAEVPGLFVVLQRPI